MKLLSQLCTTPGVPGREYRIRELIKKNIKGLFDSVETDPMGSLICRRSPRTSTGKKKSVKNPTKVMVAAHMDQIGFMVSNVPDNGFVKVSPVGGFDTRNLFARTVTVCPDLTNPKKDLVGVFNPAGKPIHISAPEERNKVPAVHEFMIDFGISGDDVKKKIKVGDMVVLNAPFYEIGDTVVSQCLDNRIACWIAIRAVEKLAKSKKTQNCEVVIVFTVQEEVGLRGARTAAYAVEPDIGIGLDTTLCCDTPGVPDDMKVTKQGDGVGITCADSSAIGDYELIEQMESLAKKNKIPYQRSLLNRGGTDTGAIQPARGGVRAMTLSCGTRYIHTVTEMIHKKDLNATVDLLAAFLADVK